MPIATKQTVFLYHANMCLQAICQKRKFRVSAYLCNLIRLKLTSVYSTVSSGALSGYRRPWPNCADTQADLSAHDPKIHFTRCIRLIPVIQLADWNKQDDLGIRCTRIPPNTFTE